MSRFVDITLACAFCAKPLSYRISDTRMTDSRGVYQRGGKLGDARCPHCSSTFTIVVATKRKRQGAGYKRTVAKQREIHAANVAEAKYRNGLIALQLLGQPGCTCVEDLADMKRSFSDSYAHRIEQLGHALDGGVSYGIPTAPRHRYGCPCRGTDEEAAIRGEKGAA